ncbi:MAG: DNA-binding transcriptional MerR regulator, partial [Parvicella sp.]
MTTAFSIRDLAQEFSVTTRTLRFYEEKGLLQPSRNKQTRSYSNADRTRLRLILRGKRLGLSLEESSDIILMYNSTSGNQQQVEHLLVKIREKRQQLLQQQEDLKLMLA